MTKALHITLAQINPVVGALSANLDKIRAIRDGASPRTGLIVFPEMALCGYPPEDLVLKPRFLDDIRTRIDALTRESADKGPALLVPCPWRGEDGKIRNAAHLIAHGRIAATIVKRHLPNYGVFDEARLFAPAGEKAEPVMLDGARLGIMICEDMWHPDVAAQLKDAGADILITVNASPYETDKAHMRLTHAQNRVRETNLPLIYVNQCGGQDELVFDGASFILNAGGDPVFRAPAFAETIHETVWEHTGGKNWLCTAGPLHEEKDETDTVYRAAMTGLRDYVLKSGFPGVLIGMSGGIDSALAAALAVDALGPDAVRCVMMPSRFTAPESREDAKACAAALGAHYEEITIEPMVAAFESGLTPHCGPGAPPVTWENIQSRCRGLILMALSNACGKMVLSTGNKSEMAVGYATIYGDMCGGFNILKDIYKTRVYDLARLRNRHRPAHALGPAGPVIPDRIIEKAPTAELRANQTDQDTLPPYPILDSILHCLIERDMGTAETAKQGHDLETVRKVARMLDAAEYKRRQAPPGVKITARAFGRDRRYPIVNRFTADA